MVGRIEIRFPCRKTHNILALGLEFADGRSVLAQARHVVVEGPIGVGKTSLAMRLAGHLRATMLLEQPSANPFLARFYNDPKRYALPTQLFFLFQRLDQLRELSQPDFFGNVVVSDYLLEKDPLFAQLNLADDEYALYRQMYATLAPQAPRPDLVIYLHAKPETLIARVRRRGIEGERLRKQLLRLERELRGLPPLPRRASRGGERLPRRRHLLRRGGVRDR